jgi:hypothetical protein
LYGALSREEALLPPTQEVRLPQIAEVPLPPTQEVLLPQTQGVRLPPTPVFGRRALVGALHFSAGIEAPSPKK